ncbi:hypothetical protein BTVI_102435 [Pitangus sulphuratus]|nr:hypothetical protein BTVI_102435 [Pitangus sulphuratus]
MAEPRVELDRAEKWFRWFHRKMVYEIRGGILSLKIYDVQNAATGWLLNGNMYTVLYLQIFWKTLEGERLYEFTGIHVSALSCPAGRLSITQLLIHLPSPRWNGEENQKSDLSVEFVPIASYPVTEKNHVHLIKCTLSNFSDNAKLGGAVDSFEGREALWRYLDRLGSWTITNPMKFDKIKCWILLLKWGSSSYMYKLWDKKLESSSTERDLRVQFNVTLNMSQQYALTFKRANHVFRCIRHSIAI